MPNRANAAGGPRRHDLELGEQSGPPYGTVMVVPSPVAVMENVPAVLDVYE